MGFQYLGPVDGHDIKRLRLALQSAKMMDGPVCLHVITKKGKGYPPAEATPDLYHGVGPFDPTEGVKMDAKMCIRDRAYAARLADYRSYAESLIDDTQEDGTQLVRTVIEHELESYILDKAQAYGASNVEVSVTCLLYTSHRQTNFG